MPKIKIKEGKQDLLNIIKDLLEGGNNDIADQLILLVTKKGYSLPQEITRRKNFGVLHFEKTELRRITYGRRVKTFTR